MEKLLLATSEGAVRTLTLNRPDRMNALSFELMAVLNSAFEEIEQDETIRAVLLSGTGRGFSAGADLTVSGSGPLDLGDIIHWCGGCGPCQSRLYAR